MIPGTKIALGDREFIIPPLSLGQLRSSLSKKIEEHDKKLQDENADFTDLLLIRGEIIIAALRRNYPESEISDDEFWERLDMGNAPIAWRAVIALSGLDPVGEAKAALEEGQSIASSLTTLPSPPLTDGLIPSSTN